MNLKEQIEELQFKVKVLEEIIDSSGSEFRHSRKRCDNDGLNEIRHFIGMED